MELNTFFVILHLASCGNELFHSKSADSANNEKKRGKLHETRFNQAEARCGMQIEMKIKIKQIPKRDFSLICRFYGSSAEERLAARWGQRWNRIKTLSTANSSNSETRLASPRESACEAISRITENENKSQSIEAVS